MKVKDLTTEQLKLLFCAAIVVNSEKNVDLSFISLMEQHYGEIITEWDNEEGQERWIVQNSFAKIELTTTIKFRCGMKWGDTFGALLFNIVATYKCLESFGLIK